MASYNRVILMGNLTRDPELRHVPSGAALVEVGLAVNDKRKNANGEWVEETTFVDVTFWGRVAEVVDQYLSKGSPILVEGRLKLDSWEGNDGQKRSKLRVVGERMQMLGTRGGGGNGGEREPRQQQQQYRQQPEPTSTVSNPQTHALPGPPVTQPGDDGGAALEPNYQESDIPF